MSSLLDKLFGKKSQPSAPAQQPVSQSAVTTAPLHMDTEELNADIVGAQEAGIFAVWITRRASTPSNQELIGIVYPDAVINTLAELPALLEKLTLEIDEDKRFS